jgi:hypothetical protein
LLTVASYQAIGGIQGALATHADDVIAQLNAPQQKLTQKIFRRLVTPERTRAIVELADLYQLAPDRAEVGRIIDQLVAARLIVVQTRGDAGGGTAEIVHESLIDRWPMMRRWLDEDQEDAAFVAQLAAAAKQWEARGHAAGLLWRGDAMEEARRWYGQRPRELVPRDAAFLHAVFALAQRGKALRRFLLAVTFIVLGGGAVAASAAALMIHSAQEQAETNERLAKDQTEVANKAAATAKQALADRDKKDAERVAAENKAHEAETVATTAQTAEAAEKRSHLQDNAEHIKQLEAEKATAVAAQKTAEAAAAEAKKAKDQLAVELAKSKAEVERMKNEKLTRTLK